MRKTSISVIIPLYNKEKYIQASIESVLAQEGYFREIVVIDDGSTDSGHAIVARMNDNRIRLVRQPNSGVSAARNRGVKEASGDYVAFLDADDMYLDGFLSAAAEMISIYPEAGMYATSYKKVYPNGSITVPKAAGIRATDAPQILNDFYRAWCKSPLFSASSICLRRFAMNEGGIEFPVGERLGEDQEVWFRMAEKYPIAYCRRPLSLYKVDVPGSLTTGAQNISLLPCYLRLAERVDSGHFPERFKTSAQRLVSSHYLNVARRRMATGDRRGAMELILDARAKHNLPYWLRCLALSLLTKLRQYSE